MARVNSYFRKLTKFSVISGFVFLTALKIYSAREYFSYRIPKIEIKLENSNIKEENTIKPIHPISSLHEVVLALKEEREISSGESLENIANNVVMVKSRLRSGAWGVGSGILVTTDGFVISAYHVVDEGIKEAHIITQKGEDYAVKNATSIKESDISVLKADIPCEDPRPVKIKIRDYTLKKGEEVSVMGFSSGIFYRSLGIIRSTDPINYIEKFGYNPNTFETDVRGKKGQSGGAVVNKAGELIGIIVYTTKTDYGDLGCIGAVRIKEATKCIEDVISKNELENKKSKRAK